MNSVLTPLLRYISVPFWLYPYFSSSSLTTPLSASIPIFPHPFSISLSFWNLPFLYQLRFGSVSFCVDTVLASPLSRSITFKSRPFPDRFSFAPAPFFTDPFWLCPLFFHPSRLNFALFRIDSIFSPTYSVSIPFRSRRFPYRFIFGTDLFSIVFSKDPPLSVLIQLWTRPFPYQFRVGPAPFHIDQLIPSPLYIDTAMAPFLSISI